ncbi:MAG: RNA 3'-terminal phosphate cyclase [Anaerolineales bacterium]|jgi:RNA 3'-terminal phosphate cyclase (ATP)
MVEIDGSFGEGGGQILRSSLTLSAMTGQDLQIKNIRAKRKTPGLRPQHLKALEAAREICGATIEGGYIGSQSISFYPDEIRAGNYHFDIGTAGSASLVVQTVLLPLSKAKNKSTVTVTGGTHVPWSPCFHYLNLNYLPFIWKIGLDVQLRMERAGFYPNGGGQIRASINPVSDLQSLHLTERGRLIEIRGISAVAKLSRNIATRQRRQVIGRLGRRYPLNDIRVVEFDAPSPGSMILLLAMFERSQACYFALGKKGVSADKIADKAINEFESFIATQGAIDQYLADQLLLPIVFAGSASEFHTSSITKHLLTNAEVIKAFLPAEIVINGSIGEPGIVIVNPSK